MSPGERDPGSTYSTVQHTCDPRVIGEPSFPTSASSACETTSNTVAVSFSLAHHSIVFRVLLLSLRTPYSIQARSLGKFYYQLFVLRTPRSGLNIQEEVWSREGVSLNCQGSPQNPPAYHLLASVFYPHAMAIEGGVWQNHS